MPRESLQAVLGQRVLLCDGAMGTELMARGLLPGACGELWNLERPEAVRGIHESYVAAGCDLVTSNTFGASSTSLESHGLSAQARAINCAGARAARAAAGEKAWVLGDVGPFGGFLEPAGDFTAAQLQAIFTPQLEGLKEGGADGVIIETMADPAELAVAVKAARALGDWPIVATYCFSPAPDGKFRTMMGASAQDAMKAALGAGASVVGANCGTGMSLADYLALAAQLVEAAGSSPVILQPNAGAPRMTANGVVYAATGGEMAALVPALLKCGVKVIGGCCGTTPGHLRAMAQALPRV